MFGLCRLSKGLPPSEPRPSERMSAQRAEDEVSSTAKLLYDLTAQVLPHAKELSRSHVTSQCGSHMCLLIAFQSETIHGGIERNGRDDEKEHPANWKL